MSDEVKLEVIKKTQDLLGKYFKKPALTEKLLKRPPFRFIQDVISAIIKETGFLEGLFTDEELSADISKDKEAKLAVLTKLIDVVKLVTGINLTVRATKIISGHEPAKTNELLQAIGKALDKKVNSKEAVLYYKKQSEKKADAKKAGSKEQLAKKPISDASVRPERNLQKHQRVSEPEKRKIKKAKSQERGLKEKVEQRTVAKPENKPDSLKATNNEPVKPLKQTSLEKVTKVALSRSATLKLEKPADLTGDILSIKPRTPQPKSAHLANNREENTTEKDVPYKNPVRQDSAKPKKSDENVELIKPIDSGNHTEIMKQTYESPILQNSISRENTVSAKLRNSNSIDVESNAINVSNIVESEKENENDENDMVIMENNKESLFKSLGETDNNVTEEHGHLVAQIVKTEQELVNTNNIDITSKKVEIVWENRVSKDREYTAKRVGNLRNSIQTLIKYTNPLGKVLDYLQGDMEIIRKELLDYQKQNSALNTSLEEERKQTEKFMKNMEESLKDIEMNVFYEQNKIHQVKINISKNDHQIQRLLNDSA